MNMVYNTKVEGVFLYCRQTKTKTLYFFSFVDQGQLDYYGNYAPLPAMRVADFTPNAANTGPSGLEREIRERYLKYGLGSLA